jgi:type I restriction enzyme S subunit
MSFPRYPKYKASGVEWLGNVPVHWSLKPIWTFFRRVKRVGFDNEQLLSVYRDYGVIPKASRDDNFNKPSEDLSVYQLVIVGDLAVNKMKAWQGSLAISEYRGIVSPAYFVYEALHSENGRYLHYLMRSVRYIAGYLSVSKGVRVNQWDMDPQFHSRMPLLVPPLSEQTAIAEFLDRETAKIDGLVAEQKRLMELLKEKRQAVISHAVTKGLNPHAKMKPSGIEWLGDVPEGWGFKPLKHLGSIISGFAFKSTDFKPQGVRVLKIANIQTRVIDWSDDSYLPDDFYDKHIQFAVKDGDVVFALTRPIISTGLKAAIANIGSDRVLLNQRNAIFRPSEWLNKKFLYYILFCDSFKSDFLNRIDFTGLQPNISPVDISNIKVLFPSTDDQAAIAKFLDFETAEFDTLTAEAQCAIDLLQERRTALISAAVTGQIDVRNQPSKGKP